MPYHFEIVEQIFVCGQLHLFSPLRNNLFVKMWQELWAKVVLFFNHVNYKRKFLQIDFMQIAYYFFYLFLSDQNI